MKRLGKQQPRYIFFLNPYPDARFTSCPQCGAKTRQRKLPLVIHFWEPPQLLSLNETCQFCPACDLLIAHEDELVAFFAAFFADSRPAVTADAYVVVGTIDRRDWARQPATPPKMFAALHDFKRTVNFQPTPTWVPRTQER